jgi:hypothetical protein
VSDSLDGVKTMSSVEIVEVINAMRAPGKAELRHSPPEALEALT